MATRMLLPVLLGFAVLLIAATGHAQPADSLDWRWLELASPLFKPKPAKKSAKWPYYVGGGIILGGVINWAVKDKDENLPPLVARADAVTIPCSGEGTINVLANDEGEGLGVQDIAHPAGVSVQNSGNGTLLISTTTGVGTVSFTYTLYDRFGQTATATVTVSIADDLPPVLVCPVSITLSCETNPTPDLAGQATATDLCTAQPTVGYTDVFSGTPCNQTIVRTWVAVDEAGNSAACHQTIKRRDEEPPYWMICPPDITVACGQENNLNVTGAGVLTDNCTGSPAAGFSDDLSGLGPCTGFIIRTWTGADNCDNAAVPCSQIIAVEPTNCDFTLDYQVVPANCGSNDGAISLFLHPPGNYALVWENGATGTTQQNLLPGAYTVTVSDPDQYCTQVFTLTVPEVPPTFLDALSVEAPECVDPANIAVVINASGGGTYTLVLEGPVSLTLTALPPGTVNLNEYVSLTPGTYTIQVIDTGGCLETAVVTVPALLPLTLVALNITNPGCSSCPDGSVLLQASGSGGFPLNVMVNGVLASQSNSNSFMVSNLLPGVYTVQVISDGGNGCVSNPVTVTLEPNTPPGIAAGQLWSLISPPPRPPLTLGEQIGAFLPSGSPEHPANAALVGEDLQIANSACLGFRIPAGKNSFWQGRIGQFRGRVQSTWTDGGAISTPVTGLVQEFGFRQLMPVPGKVQPFAEIGGGRAQLRAEHSLRVDRGQVLSTPAKAERYSVFFRNGFQVQIRGGVHAEFSHRLEFHPNPANTAQPVWKPVLEGGLQVQL